MSDIRALTLIGNTASRPIGNALTQEKLTNDIQNPVNHCISPDSPTNPATPNWTRTRKRAHYKTRDARDADETNNITQSIK